MGQHFINQFIISDLNDLEKFAKWVYSRINASDIIALEGDLGVGKTTFTQFFAKSMGVEESVTSPTFNIVKIYRGTDLTLYHFDAYRLKNSEDFFEIGGEDYLEAGGISIIEWPSNIEKILPESTKWIFMDYDEDMIKRRIRCTF